MEVCILAPVHSWDDVRIFRKEAQSLNKAGYKVTLVAQSDKVFEYDKVKVISAPKYKSRLQRFFNHFKVLYIALKVDADVYHLHNPDMLPIAFILKFLGKKVIYDTHEDFSQRILMREWIPKIIRNFIAKRVTTLEKVAARILDAVIVTQEEQVQKFKYNTILVDNSPILNNEVIEESLVLKDQIKKRPEIFRLIYIGTINETRGIFEIVDVLSTLNNHINCRLWLIGELSNELKSVLVKKDGWEYVDYLGYRRQAEAFAYLQKSDVGIVTIKDVGDHSKTSANKLYEYQRFAVPFIASDFPKWRNQLDSIKSGFFVNPDDLNQIVETILALQANPDIVTIGKRGEHYIFNEFNWELESKKLLNLYEKIKQKK